jgi:excinuclease UvrABC nuclease subunit
MLEAASQLDFERAAALRDRLRELTASELLLKDPAASERLDAQATRGERQRRRPRPGRRR